MSKYTSILAALSLAATTASGQRAPVKLPPRPDAAAPKAFALPRATMDSLPNGIRFAVVENHELPIVTVRIALAGAAPRGAFLMDPAGKSGTYGLMMYAMREGGTKTRSGTQILEEAADLGAELNMLSTLSFPAPWFRSPRSTWIPALSLLADFYMNPAFQPDVMSRSRTNLAGFYERATVGAQAAQNTMLTMLYGVGSPSNKWGSGASVRAITDDDVKLLHSEYIRPQNTLVVIAGDVTPAAAREAMLVAFGGWQRGGPTIAPISITPAPAAQTTIYIYDTPGVAQATIAAGNLVPARDHPDAAAIETMAVIVGDVAQGRVYTEFRKERGLSYNPRVDISPRPYNEMQPIFASGAVSPTVIDTAVLTYIRVLREVKTTKPITEAEFANAKKSQLRSVPRQLERLDAVAGNVLASIVDRLPPNHISDWMTRMSAVTLAEVQAATKYLDPDHLVIAVAADRSKVEQALRATGLPVVIVDK